MLISILSTRQAGNIFGPFLHIEFRHHGCFKHTLDIKYERICLRFSVVRAKSISHRNVSLFFQF